MALSHHERLQRRSAMAKAVRDGKTVEEVCKEYSVTRYTVMTACRENLVQAHTMPSSRASRREQIASAVRNGSTIADAAKEFGVGLKTVVDSCAIHNVEIKHAGPNPKANAAFVEESPQFYKWVLQCALDRQEELLKGASHGSGAYGTCIGSIKEIKSKIAEVEKHIKKK